MKRTLAILLAVLTAFTMTGLVLFLARGLRR